MKRWKHEVIYLQETKVSSISASMTQSVWKIKEIGLWKLPTNGAADGIVIIWNDGLLNCDEVLVGYCFVSYLFEDRRVLMGVLMGVLKNGKGRERSKIWEDFGIIQKEMRFLLGGRGDFNMVLHR